MDSCGKDAVLNILFEYQKQQQQSTVNTNKQNQTQCSDLCAAGDVIRFGSCGTPPGLFPHSQWPFLGEPIHSGYY